MTTLSSKQSAEVNTISQAANLVSFVLIASILYVGRDILIPVALAILLSFLLAPLVLKMQRHGLPRALSVMLIAGSLFLILGIFAWVTVVQVVDLANSLPTYEDNIRLKAESFQGARAQVLERVAERVEQVSILVANQSSVTGRANAPLLVQVVEPSPSLLQVMQTWLGPVVAPLGMVGLVAVIVLFMLLQWSNLRDRILRLTGQGHLSVATEAFDDAARRISHYLLAQFAINVATGLIVGIGLFFIGIPNAPLWGLFSVVLRYIPFVGPWLAALFPLMVAVVVAPGWETPLLTLALFITVEFISNTFIEPLAYGSSTGVSSLGIMVSAIVWGAMWGPVGLILATPMTVCLVVMGRYIPQLNMFYVLLGDQPALPAEARLYHRLLALDAVDAAEELAAFEGGSDLTALFEQLLAPAVVMAERDRQYGELSDAREDFVYSNLRCFIENAQALEISSVTSSYTESDLQGLPQQAVVCLPAGDWGDTLGSLMLAHLVASKQQAAMVFEEGIAIQEQIDLIGSCKARYIVISVMPPYSLRQPRDLCRAIRAHYPHMPIVVMFWASISLKTRDMLLEAGATQVASSLDEVLQVMARLHQPLSPQELVSMLGAQLLQFDTEGARAILDQSLAVYEMEDVISQIVQPLLYNIGQGWVEGNVSIEQEHFATDFIRACLIHLSDQFPPPRLDAPRAIAACAPDEEHEIGLLGLTVLLRQQGWNVVYLGQRVPGGGLPMLVDSVQPHMLLFSASQSKTAAYLVELARSLLDQIAPPPTLLLGGQGFSQIGDHGVLPGVILQGDARTVLRYIREKVDPRPIVGAGQEPHAEVYQKTSAKRLLRPKLALNKYARR